MLSSSDVTPYENSAPPAVGTSQVYLWFECTLALEYAEFGIDFTGGIVPIGFQPLNGFLNAGTTTELLLAVAGCPNGFVVAGVFTTFDATGAGGAICFGPSGSGGNYSVECGSPVQYSNNHVGFSTTGTPACGGLGSIDCGLVGVDAASWGSVKSLYR